MIIREFDVVINYTSGSTLTLTDANAQNAWAAWTGYIHGGQNSNRGFMYTNAGDTIAINFECVCSVVRKPITETVGPDPECDPLDCLNPAPVPVP